MDALDAAGSPFRRLKKEDALTPAGPKAIALELVRGQGEEVYWDRVLEKVRRQAVMKALGFGSNGGCSAGHDQSESSLDLPSYCRTLREFVTVLFVASILHECAHD